MTGVRQVSEQIRNCVEALHWRGLFQSPAVLPELKDALEALGFKSIFVSAVRAPCSQKEV